MNAHQYARLVGVSPQAISAAITRGEIVPTERGLIDVAQADATYGARRAERAARQSESRDASLRREQAMLRTTLAKIQIARHRATEMQARLVERDKSQAVIGDLIARLCAALSALATDAAASDRPLLREAADLILRDLGDLQAEALKVTERK
jgi:hypothetical protein